MRFICADDGYEAASLSEVSPRKYPCNLVEKGTENTELIQVHKSK